LVGACVEATPEAGNDRSYEGENPPVVHIRNPCKDFPGEIYQSPFNHCLVYLALNNIIFFKARYGLTYDFFIKRVLHLSFIHLSSIHSWF
jgi:hypothetical protein